MISLIYQTENCYCFYNHDIILCELHEKIAQKDCNHPFVADAIYGIAWIEIVFRMKEGAVTDRCNLRDCMD